MLWISSKYRKYLWSLHWLKPRQTSEQLVAPVLQHNFKRSQTSVVHGIVLIYHDVDEAWLVVEASTVEVEVLYIESFIVGRCCVSFIAHALYLAWFGHQVAKCVLLYVGFFPGSSYFATWGSSGALPSDGGSVSRFFPAHLNGPAHCSANVCLLYFLPSETPTYDHPWYFLCRQACENAFETVKGPPGPGNF